MTFGQGRNGALLSNAAAVSKARTESKFDTSEKQEIQGGKDASICLLHVLGKVIYCKSKKAHSSFSMRKECQRLIARFVRARLRVVSNSRLDINNGIKTAIKVCGNQD